MTAKKRIGILISGRGSNMAALIDACRAPDYPAEVAVVISNRPDAAGLERAQAAGIETVVIHHKLFKGRKPFDVALTAALDAHGVEIVACAGFMRLLTPGFVERWQGRMINIHPSLLPAFKGLHPQRQALAASASVSGCTVHFVTLKMDSGPIIAQTEAPILPGDTEETLTARILKAEHKLYPHALRLVASGKVWMEGDEVRFSGAAAANGARMEPPLPDDMNRL